MHEEIKVVVRDYGEDRNLILQYIDPVSGRRKSKSAKTTDPREAERLAGEWERELRSGSCLIPSKVTWTTFRERYTEEHLATLAEGTRITADAAFNILERELNPDRLAKLTTAVMSTFAAKMRKQGMKDVTLARVLRHLKAALRWAERMGLMRKAPAIEMPKRAKGSTMMKGRPVTGEEFDRMILACEKVRPNDAEDWKRYLTGLWLSGLRLEESLALSWELDSPFMVDLSGRRPAFRIYAEAQKSKRDQFLPMTPDFAEWLEATFPADQRAGVVFKLRDRKSGVILSHHTIGAIISTIGEKAGVKVHSETKPDPKTGKPMEVVKYASAHDLRRSFGTRWAPKVKPATLQLLMRHSDIGTTMRFYVAQDAADVADELWANHAPQAGMKARIDNKVDNKRPIVGQKVKKVSSDESTETLVNYSLTEQMREAGVEPA